MDDEGSLLADCVEAMRGSKVLITGGLGFLGSNLARRLVNLGSQVTLVDSLVPEYGGNPFNVEDIRGQVQINVCDVRDPHAMHYLMQGQDFVFNLAGQTSHLDSMQDPETDLAINVTAQLSLLETCRKVNPSVRLVFASTRQIYGRPEYLPVDEKHPIRPVDVNGINKVAGEWYHLLYSQAYGIRASALRLTNTYGPGMRVKDARQTFLGIWIRLLLEGRPIQIFGDGSQMRDFNYVDDCVDALLLAALPQATGGVFNLGSSEVISLEHLAATLIRVHGVGSSETVTFPEDRKRVDIGDYYGDFSLFRAATGWRPRIDLETGLRRTLVYYAAHRSAYWTDDRRAPAADPEP